MALIDLLTTAPTASAGGTVATAYEEAAEKLLLGMSGSVEHSTKGGGMFSFFKRTKSPKVIEELAGKKTAGDWSGWLKQAFGVTEEEARFIDPKHLQNELHLDGILKQHEIQPDSITSAMKKQATTHYDAAVTRIKSLERTLDEAQIVIRKAGAEAIPQIIKSYDGLLQAAAGNMSDAAAAAKAAAAASGASATAGVEAAGAKLGLSAADSAKILEWDQASEKLTAKVVNAEGVLEKFALTSKSGAAVVVDEAARGNLIGALQKSRNQLLNGPKAYIEGMSTQIAEAKTQLQKSKTLIDDVGKKILGKTESAFAASAEKTAVAASTAAADVAAESNKIMNISEKAKSLGVVGEEALKEKNFFSKMLANAKANFNIDKVTKNSAGVIEATERGALGKGMVAAGAGAGAILVGYGLKDLGKAVGFVSPDIDEQGREIPADSGTLVKSVAELGAGAALAYFTLLKGGKAAGVLSV